MMIAIIIIFAFIVIFLVYYKFHILKVSFKESIGKVGLPIVSFKQDNKTFDFLIDSGADFSTLNSSTLEQLYYVKLKGAKPMYGVDGKAVPTYRVGVKLFLQNHQFVEAFQVADLPGFDKINADCGLNIVGVLGSSFLKKYEILLDFKNLRVLTTKGRKRKWFIW